MYISTCSQSLMVSSYMYVHVSVLPHVRRCTCHVGKSWKYTWSIKVLPCFHTCELYIYIYMYMYVFYMYMYM